eukprot:gene3714-2614_t
MLLCERKSGETLMKRERKREREKRREIVNGKSSLHRCAKILPPSPLATISDVFEKEEEEGGSPLSAHGVDHAREREALVVYVCICVWVLFCAEVKYLKLFDFVSSLVLVSWENKVEGVWYLLEKGPPPPALRRRTFHREQEKNKTKQNKKREGYDTYTATGRRNPVDHFVR